MMWLIIQSMINGLLAGGVYALIAVGVTIIFGVMRVVNFASSAFLIFGMYFTWLGYSLTGWNAYLLIPLVIVVMGILAFISFKLAMLPVMNKDRNATIIITVGMSFFLQNVIILVFGKTTLSVPSSIKTASLNIGMYVIGLPRLLAFSIALLLVILITLLINKTSMGRAMRSTSENTEVSEMLGINTKKIFTNAWIMGIILTGIAGLLLTPIYVVDTSIGTVFRTTALMAVVLGGLGNIKGAFIGGLILGVVEAYVSSFIDQNIGPAGIFIVFLVMLYFKPYGLFGKGERIS